MTTVNVNNYFEQADNTGDNTLVLGGTVETSTSQSLKKAYLNVRLADISTISTCFVVSPVAGTISKIYSVISGAIITDDAVITSKILTTAITSGVITITQSGSAPGDVDSATPSAANTVAVGDTINFTTDGASGNTVTADFTIEIDLS